MSKELIVTLLRKDIAELSQLTDGFEQLEIFPPVLLRLAESKAIAVLENIKALSELPAKVEVPVVEEKQVVFEPVVTILPEKKPEEQEEHNEAKNDIAEQAGSSGKEEKVMTETASCKEEKPMEEVEAETPQNIVIPQVENNEVAEESADIAQESPISDISAPSSGNDKEDDKIEEKTETVSVNPIEPLAVAEETAEPEKDMVECRVGETEPEGAKEEVKVSTAMSDASKESFTRNDSITHKKIDDIKQAISLGDRFLFQRELFNNNGELMTKTIGYLNGLTTMDEALQYVNKKFNWDSENPTVERFLQILNRRYL